MHSQAFNQTIEKLIAKHHMVTREPAARFAYLQQIAKEHHFSEIITGKVIQIAGTNGKGSTQQFLWDLLKHNGFSCHVFRSPHVIRINERMHFNHQMIEDDALLQALQWADQIVNQPIGFFALLTIAFFKCCTEQPADFILLETGLGGEFDATNSLSNHALSLITPISFDHCDVLGNELTQIAQAKAGIMRTDRPCFSGMQQPAAKKVLTQHAASLKTPISFLEDHAFDPLEDGFSLEGQNYARPGLAGDYQKQNAALALSAYRFLVDPKKQLNLEKINHAIKNTFFAGRLHPVTSGKISQQLKHDLWVDGAHNPAGVENLINFIKTSKKPVYFWLNFKNNKDIQTIFKLLKPYCHTAIFQITEQQDRAAKKDIETITDSLNINIDYADNIENAINLFNKKPKGLVLAFGSLHWVGYLLELN